MTDILNALSYEKEPMEIKIPVPNGTYEVTLHVTSSEDTVFSVLVQTRRFVLSDVPIKRGEKKDFTFAVSVCDYHMHGDEMTNVRGVEVYILCDGGLTAAAAVSPADIPTLYICGDSTVTDQKADYPYNPKSTYCGWGQRLPELLDGKIAVSNHAQSGATTADCLATNFNAFKDKIKPGDIVLAEFGHNDQKVPELSTSGGYAENLRKIVNEVRARGGLALLSSPINRIIFEPDGHLKNLLGNYRNAVCDVCAELEIPFIDMWSRTTEFYERAGCVKSWNFFYGDENGRDYTHTNDIGGLVNAKLMAREWARLGIEPLSSHIKPGALDLPDVKADPGDVPDNAAELEHLKGIGLVNTPDTIEDIDRDVTMFRH